MRTSVKGEPDDLLGQQREAPEHGRVGDRAGLVEDETGGIDGDAERRRPAAKRVHDRPESRQRRGAGLRAARDRDAADRAALEVGPVGL